jgi:hypothetical protein
MHLKWFNLAVDRVNPNKPRIILIEMYTRNLA